MSDLLTSAAGSAYLVAAVLFILTLAGLSKQETSRRGIVSRTRIWPCPSASHSATGRPLACA